jgi:O-acetyl-ADP-ribose deacetylase (regulator of RNase III)
MNEILRTSTSSKFELQLVQGDITLAPVEAIVNPANSQLQHGGGLAGLISRKSGPVLQQESSAWVRKHGPVEHHSPAYTSAGDLPFRYIIHAVGPVWGSGNEHQKLQEAVGGSLALADQLKIKSIAIPAISTGIFGFPLDPAAEVILSGIDNYAASTPDSYLQTVQVVLYGDQAASVFAAVWDRREE